MYSYEFTAQGLRDFKRLDWGIQKRIVKKLDYFVSSNNPLSYADRLVNWEIGQYRFRMGDYRVIFDLEGEKIVILTAGHRREVYR